MKSLKIISLMLAIFLFQPAFANAPAGSCRSAVENLEVMGGTLGMSTREVNLTLLESAIRQRYPIISALEHFSVVGGRPEQKIVEFFLEKSDPDFRYNYEDIEKQFEEIVEKLEVGELDRELIYGVRDGASDLMLVAQYGTPEMVMSLVEKGHNPLSRDKKGWRAIDYAKLNPRKEEIRAAYFRQ